MSLFKPEILQAYEESKPRLEGALDSLLKSWREELAPSEIRIYGMTGRVKAAQSLTRKASRPDRTYENIWNITDVIGLRIVTGFEDDVEEVGKRIEDKHVVDLANSHNRIVFDDHERFGYRSLHYVCHFPESFGFPPEARFEIQVRTALQDVWAELEHDLGYKASDLAPSKLRRRFSRVSSLLEIAEEELVQIRRELRSYVEGQRDHAGLDVISVKSLSLHKDVEKLDQKIAKILGLPMSAEGFFPDYLLKALRFAGFSTAEEVLSALSAAESKVLDFVPQYFEFARQAWDLRAESLKNVPRGYTLLFLVHTHLLESESLAVNQLRKLTKFYSRLDYAGDSKTAAQVANTLLTVIGPRVTSR